MPAQGRVPALICAGLIIAFGIIHFSVGISIPAQYAKYQDIYRPSIGLGAYNIVIGFYAVAVGIICIIGVVRERPALSK